MKPNNQFITQEAAQKINKEKLQLVNTKTLPKNSLKFFQNQQNKNKTIHIYDIGFNELETIIPINNHINKTGLNPLQNNQKKQIIFFDITNIYQQQKNGKTAECFGLHDPHSTNPTYIQARFICHHTIAAYCSGFKTIFAYIIN